MIPNPSTVQRSDTQAPNFSKLSILVRLSTNCMTISVNMIYFQIINMTAFRREPYSVRSGNIVQIRVIRFKLT